VKLKIKRRKPPTIHKKDSVKVESKPLVGKNVIKEKTEVKKVEKKEGEITKPVKKPVEKKTEKVKPVEKAKKEIKKEAPKKVVKKTVKKKTKKKLPTKKIGVKKPVKKEKIEKKEKLQEPVIKEKVDEEIKKEEKEEDIGSKKFAYKVDFFDDDKNEEPELEEEKTVEALTEEKQKEIDLLSVEEPVVEEELPKEEEKTEEPVLEEKGIEELPKEEVKPEESEFGEDETPGEKKIKIMVVDDEHDILFSVEQVLVKSNYEVITADNGKDCFDILRSGIIPDLIILDIMMPIMSGWEIQRRLENNIDWKDIPIIFLTARTTPAAEDMCRRLGNDFITKPFDVSDLKDRIEMVLKGKTKEVIEEKY